MSGLKKKKILSADERIALQNNSAENFLGKKINRRKAIATGAVAGLAVAGLAVGGAAGYLIGSSGASSNGQTQTVTKTVTGGGGGSTVTQTVTNTITASGGGGVTQITAQTLAGLSAQYLQYAADAYGKQHPNVKVNVLAIPEANMNASSIAAVATAPPPDIIYNSTLPAFNAQIVDPGYALQLDSYVDAYQWKQGTTGTFTAYGNVSGHWYWVTVGTIYYGNVYFNVDLFKSKNIAPPTDQASFFAAAAALKAEKLLPLVHGYQTQPEWFMNTFSDFLMNHISSDDYHTLWTSYGPDLKTSKFASRPIKMTDQPVLDIWNLLADLRDKVLAPGVSTMSDQTAVSLFSSQQAGMYAIGSWGAAALEKPINDAFKYSFVPISQVGPPTTGGGSLRIVTFPLPYFVVKNTKSPDLCADFLNFVLSSPIQQYIFTQIGPFPIIPLGPAITADPYLQLSLNYSGQLDGRPSLAAAIATELHDPFESAISGVLSGATTPADAADSIETLAKQVNATG